MPTPSSTPPVSDTSTCIGRCPSDTNATDEPPANAAAAISTSARAKLTAAAVLGMVLARSMGHMAGIRRRTSHDPAARGGTQVACHYRRNCGCGFC